MGVCATLVHARAQGERDRRRVGANCRFEREREAGGLGGHAHPTPSLVIPSSPSPLPHSTMPLVIKHASSKYVLKGEDTLTVAEGTPVRLRGHAGETRGREGGGERKFGGAPSRLRASAAPRPPRPACPSRFTRPGRAIKLDLAPDPGPAGVEKGGLVPGQGRACRRGPCQSRKKSGAEGETPPPTLSPPLPLPLPRPSPAPAVPVCRL